MRHPDTAVPIGIIDPDLSSRVAAARLLSAHGHPAISFVSIADYAAHVASAKPIPVLFVDAGEYLKGGAGGRPLLDGSVVVAIASEARLTDIGRALAAGCVDYLVRPLESCMLTQALDQAMAALPPAR